MKKIILFLLLFASPLLAVEPWVRTHTALRTIYVTPNSNFGKLLDSVTGDYMGLENLARLNDVTVVSGWQGNSLSITGNTCSGTCDEPYFRPTYVDTLDDTTWSVSWWFKSSAPTTGTMWAFWASTGPQLAAVVNCNAASTGQVSCLIRDDAGTSLTLTTTGTTKMNNQWHHAMLVAEAGNIHRLYIDGALNVSNTSTTIGVKTEIEKMDFNPNNSSAYTGNYVGFIDEFHVYSDAKTLANAVTLYNANTPHTTVLPNATAVYHFNENFAAAGLTTDARIDFDEINNFLLPGDLVSLEAVPSDPGYLSDRPKEDIDYTCTVTTNPPVERFCFLGPWYTITASGTAANPILFKCEGDWPSDCRFQSRIEFQGDFTWVWGMWFTGVQGNNTTNCKTSDNGPASVSLEGRGSALINNWLFHPASFPEVVSVPPDQAYQTTGFDFSSYTTSYAPSSSLDGYTGGFITQQAQGPERVIYGNIMKGGGHGLYSQNNYFTSGYIYYIQNMYGSEGEWFECDPDHFAGQESGFSMIAGYWSTNNEVSGIYAYKNFYSDTEGHHAGKVFHASQGDPSQYSFIDSNEMFCGGRMITNRPGGNLHSDTGPDNGYFQTGTGTQGHPHAIKFTNNFLASCQTDFQFWWADSEVQYTQEVPSIVTGNTILVDPTLGTLSVTLDTSAYETCDATCAVNLDSLPGNNCVAPATCREPEGRGRLRATDLFDNNTYTTGATFDAHWDGCEDSATGVTECNTFEGMTLAQWRTQSAVAGKAFDVNSTTITYPVTGSRVILYRNEYDTSLGNLMIYNWAEADSIAVNFNTVVPRCSRFNLFDAELRPDATPVLANEVNNGSDIDVPMDGDLVRTYRIQIISE